MVVVFPAATDDGDGDVDVAAADDDVDDAQVFVTPALYYCWLFLAWYLYFPLSI